MDEEKQQVKQDWKEKAQAFAMAAARQLFGLTGHWGQAARNNFELGQRYLANGQMGDAILRFRIVCWLEPENVEAWYGLGCAYIGAHNLPGARKALGKTLELRPGFVEAATLLAQANAGL